MQFIATILIDGQSYIALVRQTKTQRSLKLAKSQKYPATVLSFLEDEGLFLSEHPSLANDFLQGKVVKC